jgi:hypothetical protein
MRPHKFWPATLPFLFAVALGAGRMGQAQSAESNVFIIAGADGYGVEDCLAEAGECGHVVADAWCEAHGHGAALSFGLAEDVTNAISGGGDTISHHPYMVRCGD